MSNFNIFSCQFRRFTLVILSVFILLGVELHAQQFSTSDKHTMFICPDGKLTGSGNNASGQMGTNEYLPNQGIQLLDNGPWKMVSCGSAHTMLIKSDNTLWATGNGGYLGLGDYESREAPVQVGTDNDWVFVEAGVYTSFGIKEDGTLWSWGVAIYGQLGLDAVVEALVPQQVGVSDKWVAVAAAQEYTIGLQSDGTLWGWGDNSNGKLGDGTTTSKTTPAKVSTAGNWAKIAVAEGGHSLALDSTGYLWGTGLNNFGQLGLPEETYLVDEWTQLDSDNTYIEIASGKDHSLAIRNDHTLWASGRNDFGQLGIGTTEKSFGFVQVGDQSDWEMVTASSAHSLAINGANKLLIWGKNKDWQMPSCDEDGLYQCNEPLLIENYCGSDPDTTTQVGEIPKEDLLIYPVPFSDQLHFEYRERIDLVRIMDLTGRTVIRSEKVGSDIDVADLSQGLYIIEVVSEGSRYTQRIVKQ